MHMKRILFVCGLLVCLITGCDKNDDSAKANAEIIGFNPDKSYCNWGWTIKVGNKTIKSDNAIIGETIGYEGTYPIKVYVELGNIENSCSVYGIEYYQVKKIKKIE